MWNTISELKSTLKSIASDVIETAADLESEVRAGGKKCGSLTGACFRDPKGAERLQVIRLRRRR